MSSGSSSSAQPNGSSSNARHRDHQQGRQDREYTAAQKSAVERIRACRVTAYYEILSVKKEATDGEIKKAYHKLSLATHPDKNGAPGADEAFKLVSKAFQVLSDPQKRSIYDQTGGDPDSRGMPSGGGGGGSPMGHPFAGFAGSPRGTSGMFEADLTPEDLLNMMFGGGMGPGVFGNAQGFTTFGGPGIRVHQFGGGMGPGMRRRRTAERGRAEAEDAQEAGTGFMKILIQLLPLIIFFLIPALGSLFTSDGAPPKGPQFALSSQPPFTLMRETPNYKIPFYVNPADMQDLSKRDISSLDRRAETSIVNSLNFACAREEQERQQAIVNSEGWLFVDQEKRKRAKAMPMPNCRKMEDLGIRRQRNY